MSPDNKPRRRLRNFLLEPRVQLRVTLVMVTLTSALTAVLGWIWYAEIRKASGVIRVNAISVVGSEAADQLGGELAAQDVTRLWILIGFGVALAVLIAAFGIVMTHKFAGPIYKMKRHVVDIAEERLYPLWGLRKGDLLQGFFSDFQRMHDALRERAEADVELLTDAAAAIERGDDLGNLATRLRERAQQKHRSLREASNVTKRIKREVLTG